MNPRRTDAAQTAVHSGTQRYTESGSTSGIRLPAWSVMSKVAGFARRRSRVQAPHPPFPLYAWGDNWPHNGGLNGRDVHTSHGTQESPARDEGVGYGLVALGIGAGFVLGLVLVYAATLLAEWVAR